MFECKKCPPLKKKIEVLQKLADMNQLTREHWTQYVKLLNEEKKILRGLMGEALKTDDKELRKKAQQALYESNEIERQVSKIVAEKEGKDAQPKK